MAQVWAVVMFSRSTGKGWAKLSMNTEQRAECSQSITAQSTMSFSGTAFLLVTMSLHPTGHFCPTYLKASPKTLLSLYFSVFQTTSTSPTPRPVTLQVSCAPTPTPTPILFCCCCFLFFLIVVVSFCFVFISVGSIDDHRERGGGGGVI